MDGRTSHERDEGIWPSAERRIEIAERGFEALLKSAPDAIVIVNADGRIVLINSQAEQLFGYTREELLGQPLEMLIPERFRAIHRRHRTGYVAAPRTRPMGVGLELYARRRDGTEFPAEISLSPVETDQGLLITSIIRDVTERKRTEAERALLFQREQEARAAAERAADTIQRLQAVTDAAMARLGLEELLRELPGRIRDVLQVDTAAILLLDPSTNALVPRAAHGLEEESGGGIQIPVGRGFAGRVAAERRPIILEDIDQADIVSPRLRESGVRSVVGAPLMIEGRVIGVVHMGSLPRRQFDDADVRLLQLVADRVALAIDRAHLYDAQRAALAAAEAAERRAAFLAQASSLLAGSLDYETTLASVARLAVPFLADWCAIDILEDDVVSRVAVAHVDPAKEELLRTVVRRYPNARDARILLSHVLETGETAVVSDLSEAMLPHVTRQESLDIIQRVGARSVIAAPLVARGRILGALTLVMSESGRRYESTDVTLAEDLARRAALAVDNARLYRDAQEAEETIQRQATRANTLSEASRVIAEASLDFQAVLETVAHQVSTGLEGGCVIRLLSEDHQQLDPVAVYHPDREILALVRELVKTPIGTEDGMSGQVLQSGGPVLLPSVDPQRLREVVTDSFEPYVDRFAIHSILGVPLRVRGRAIGTLTVWRDAPDLPYTLDDQSFLQDLADRAALAVDNAMLYREAQEAVLAREEFLSVASHELKTPLTTVKGWVHLIVGELRQPEIERQSTLEFAGELQTQVDRFELLIADLLDASRIQQGHLDLRPEPVNLVELTRRVLTRFEHAPERTPRHRLTLAGSRRLIGVWDPDRLDQVLTNLLSNALKYSPEGGEVHVHVQRVDGQAEITVSDQGIGIAEKDQARLFQPFSRSETARRSASGTGLGLYITSRIVEQHGGQVFLTSEPGVGTTVRVRLPLTAPGREGTLPASTVAQADDGKTTS